MTTDPCAWSARDDVFEAYMRGTLDVADRDAFEDHYFACPACLAKFRAYEGLRAELGAVPAEAPAAERPFRFRSWRWALVPAAGVIVVAAAVLWFRGSAPSPPESTMARAPEPAGVPAAQPAAPAATKAPEAAPAAVPPGQPAPTAKQAPRSAPLPVVALSVLARIEAPPYAPATLRGPQDEAAVKFDQAMRLYVKRDYAGAIPGLGAAAGLRPDVPQYAFFLGICHLLTGNVEQAAAALQKAIAIGESPYLEEAHFYLAKARLRQEDIRAARGELEWTIARQGRLEADARRLLAQVDALPPKR